MRSGDGAGTELARIDAMMRCMAFIGGADGTIEPRERAMFADIVERLTGTRLNRAQLADFLDRPGGDFFDPAAYLQKHGDALDAAFRRLIFMAACFIAMADGAMAAAEADRLRALGAALEIPSPEHDAIVAGLGAGRL